VRATRLQIAKAADQYLDALQQCGAVPVGQGLELTTGSPTNGILWSVHLVEREDGRRRRVGGTVPGIPSGRLGSSAREALDTLHLLTRLLGDLEYLGILTPAPAPGALTYTRV